VGVGFAVAFFILRKQFLKIFSCFRKNLIKPIFSSAYPIALIGFFGVFMLNTDIIMLGWWRTPEEIGYYSAGQKIIQLLYALPAILATSTFPVLARFAGNKEKDKIKILMEKLMTMVFFIAIPIFIGGVILGRPVIEFLYGKEYLPAAPAFQILLFTPFFIFPQMFLGNLILANDEQRRLKLPVALGSLGNIVFNAFLIPVYGIVGSAFATLIAQLLNTGLTWRIAKKINDFATFRHLKKITAGAIIMGVFSFLLNKLGLNVIINIVASSGIYFGALYLLKEKILEEIIGIFKKLKSSGLSQNLQD